MYLLLHGPKSIIRPDTMVDLSQDNSAEEIRKNQKSQDKNVRKNDNSRPNSSQVALNSLLAVSNSKSLSNGTRLCDSSSLLTSAAPKSGLVSFLGSNPTPSKPPGHSNAPMSTTGTPSAPEGGREGLVIISGEKSGPKSIIRPDTMVDLSQDNSAEEIRKNQKSQDKNVRKNDNSRPNSSQVALNSLLAVSNSKSLSNGTRLCDSSSLLTSAAPKSGLVSHTRTGTGTKYVRTSTYRYVRTY